MTRRGITAPLVKSLVFIAVTALATTALALGIAGGQVEGTVAYRARFTDVTGLTVGDSVRIAGVTVGQVDGVGVVDHRIAEVRFSVARDHPLPASVTAAVKYLNLVGQRYVDLGQGSGPVGRTLPPGSVIPLDRTSPALDLTQLFNGFQPLFQGLSPRDVNQLATEIVQVLQGEGGTVDTLIGTVGSLTTTLAAKDKVIGEVIDNLGAVLKTVDDHRAGFDDLVATLQQLVTGFAADREPLGESITAVSQLTTSTADLLQQGRAPLKDSIAQLGRLSGNLAAGTPQLEGFLRNTPAKMRAVGRLASYGSWLNLYLCQAKVTGVTTADGSKPPTGIPVTQPRCRS
ncbi:MULTISPECIES: MCE family protein [Streptomycetaceae]|uniref:Putative Mce family protein n=1 Tax=Streptantibioticus cattleyicolor (strain ATCC 35852 / DSM 46488 / JCM 4925 / NBRC 14057 / NRRL 8057) TaxID=1003195 RepID=F8JUH0_STREN|nr:MCE family protein [Streptantibioticus cattleyicolor]AEW95592.1 putative Mce family protein [Streptantibioticus cattleyicolor NRRL 8057 = DSM 46488]MYS60142.1 MCE family protein [Streptomyces sp. SID5468]CCB75929.1 putative Mce family protein [Streptantibioticus cattleyicolor NRRL 8057 = DSM 46488]